MPAETPADLPIQRRRPDVARRLKACSLPSLPIKRLLCSQLFLSGLGLASRGLVPRQSRPCSIFWSEMRLADAPAEPRAAHAQPAQAAFRLEAGESDLLSTLQRGPNHATVSVTG